MTRIVTGSKYDFYPISRLPFTAFNDPVLKPINETSRGAHVQGHDRCLDHQVSRIRRYDGHRRDGEGIHGLRGELRNDCTGNEADALPAMRWLFCSTAL